MDPDGRDLAERVDLVVPLLGLVVAEVDVDPFEGHRLLDQQDLDAMRERTHDIAVELEQIVALSWFPVRVCCLLCGGRRGRGRR